MPRKARKRAKAEYVLQFCTRDEFIGMNNENVDTICMDISDKVLMRVTDEQANDLMRKIAKCENSLEFQQLETVKRDKYLKNSRRRASP